MLLICFALLSCDPGKKDRSAAETDTIQPDSLALRASQPSSESESPAEETCMYDNNVSSLGIGLIIAPTVFTLWNDSSTTEEYLVVDIYKGEGTHAICPKFYERDYGIAHFICLESNESYYKVLTDHATVKYLRTSTDGIEFKTWDGYILNSFGIRRKTSLDDQTISAQPLRTEGHEDASTLKIPDGLEMFCPMEIKGDWIKVKYDCFYNREQNPHEGEPCHNFIEECESPLTGWLRWRDRNSLLIDIFLLP